MAHYVIEPEVVSSSTTLLRVGFGDEPASNDAIVVAVEERLAQLSLGGKLCLISGPASLPVAFVLAHRLVHMFGAIAVFDPKLQQYVVCVSHDADYWIGQLVSP